jgi:hypothetical protein
MGFGRLVSRTVSFTLVRTINVSGRLAAAVVGITGRTAGAGIRGASDAVISAVPKHAVPILVPAAVVAGARVVRGASSLGHKVGSIKNSGAEALVAGTVNFAADRAGASAVLGGGDSVAGDVMAVVGAVAGATSTVSVAGVNAAEHVTRTVADGVGGVATHACGDNFGDALHSTLHVAADVATRFVEGKVAVVKSGAAVVSAIAPDGSARSSPTSTAAAVVGR